MLDRMRAVAEELSVRKARVDDIPRLGDIWLELMQHHERVDNRFALADDALGRWKELAVEMVFRDDSFVFVAEDQGRPLGFCIGWVARNPPIYRVSDVGFISEIAVTRAVRRRGIGRALVNEARRWFRAQGLEEFQLSTAIWNESAQAFWRAIGGAAMLIRYRFPIEPRPDPIDDGSPHG